MRYRLLAILVAVLSSAAGCRSHIHAGGGQGFDAGAAVGPRAAYSAPPPPVLIPDPLPRS
jgi:hypothetical protein